MSNVRPIDREILRARAARVARGLPPDPTPEEVEAVVRAMAEAGLRVRALAAAMAPALAEMSRKLARIQAAAVANDPVFALTQRPEWRAAVQGRRNRNTGPAPLRLDGRPR